MKDQPLRWMRLSTALKWLFVGSLICIAYLIFSITSLTISEKEEIQRNNFEFCKTIVNIELEYLEECFLNHPHYDETQAIISLSKTARTLDNENGFLAVLLDDKLSHIPSSLSSTSLDNRALLEHTNRELIRSEIRNSEQGELRLQFEGKDILVYFKAYPISQRRVFIVIGVSPEVTKYRTIFSTQLVYMTLALLGMAILGSLLMSLNALRRQNLQDKELLSLANELKTPKDENSRL